MKFYNFFYDTIYTYLNLNKVGLIVYKICKNCKKNKSIESFYKKAGYYKKECIECLNLKRRHKYRLSICRNCKIEFRPGVEGRYKFCSEQCRFLNKVEKQDNGCWFWKAGKNKTGYGCFVQLGKRSGLAHRASFRLFKGPIPKNLHILHSCHEPKCCAPDHLRPGTPKDNSNDRKQAGRTTARKKIIGV